MRNRLSMCPLLVLCVAVLSCNVGGKVIADYEVVPQPEEIVLNDAGFFELNAGTRIALVQSENDECCNAEFLARYIGEIIGKRPVIITCDDAVPETNVIVLCSASQGRGPENYEISISEDRIKVEGGSDAGVFYGLQTLRKAMGVDKTSRVLFPTGRISDKPLLGYRGVMLDVGRTFYPVEEVKRVIDIAALHNLNVFHWHLTDDQGWRIEIDAYPELTGVGAFRRDTTLSGEQTMYGGYYTKTEILDIIDYASKRYMEVIPEIDMPGHMTAALAAFPELGCTGGPYNITSQPGVRRDILCAGNPETMSFIETVLKEVIELFPSEYIHIGGDEAPKSRWRTCARCQSLIRDAGIAADEDHSAEAKLQGYFNTCVEKFLAEHGRKLVGWDEIVDGGLSPNATVMSWRGTKGGVKAANAGYDVIMSPNSSLYFDYYQSYNVETEPPTICGYVPLKKVYETTVFPEDLAPSRAHHIIGVQANIWTTYMRDEAVLEYMMLPRMAALAEIGWSSKPKDYDGFMSRMDALVRFYEHYGYNYFPYFYDVDRSFTVDYERKAIGMTLASSPKAKIYYTLDGTSPSESSDIYRDTVWIDSPATIRAVAVMPDGRLSEPFSEQITFSKAAMRKIDLLTSPCPKYSEASLNDGLCGKRIFAYGNWLGFQDEELVAVIDLGDVQEINQVAFNSLLDYGSHIMDASGAEIMVSADGENYETVYSEQYGAVPYGAVKRILHHKADFNPSLAARYVKVRIMPSERLPEPFFDSGSRPFLFVDEIYVH